MQVRFARVGGGGKPSLPIRYPLPLALGKEMAPNGRFMVFMMRPCETQP